MHLVQNPGQVTGAAGADEQPPEAGQLDDEFVRQSIGQEPLLFVTTRRATAAGSRRALLQRSRRSP